MQATDLSYVIADLRTMAEDSLGNRAGKLTKILTDSEPTPAGLELAIDQIASTLVPLVDESRMRELASRMRARLRSTPQ